MVFRTQTPSTSGTVIVNILIERERCHSYRHKRVNTDSRMFTHYVYDAQFPVRIVIFETL